MSRRERVQLEPAFLLHAYDYRDSSRLVEFFTLAHGRLTTVAKGARRAKSKFRALLQPFNPLQISWSGGELPTLTAVEPGDRQPWLTGKSLYSAYYLNELLLKLTAKRDPHPEVFATYRDTLVQLAGGQDEAVCLRLFERDFLEALGYGLNFLVDRDSGEEVVDGHWYHFNLEQGPRKAAEQGANAIPGSSLRALAKGRLETRRALRDAKTILRGALEAQLGNKPLQTRRVVGDMKIFEDQDRGDNS